MKIITEESEKLILEVTGETDTICNILRKRLMQQEDVKSAAYDITHPLIGQPELEVNSPNPRESIVEALTEVKQEASEFKEIIQENVDD